MKPIKVWGQGGPNPPKVAILLEELGVPYDAVDMPLSDVKKPEYLAVNPNGRIPAIHDSNTDITIWESGAIFLYLIERYDSKHKFSFGSGTPEFYHAQQWLCFQASGQGPYYGQASWFKKFHFERVPSALERYCKEMNRITGVLEGYLAQQKEMYPATDGPWLVGNKVSYADLSFIPWQEIIKVLFDKDEYDEDNFPHVKEWLGKMTSRESTKKVIGVAWKAKN